MTPALPPSAPMAIAVEDVSALAWCRIGEHLVFLDVARDRYFRLPPQSEREFLAAGKNNARGGWAQPDFLPRPSEWQKPAKTSPAQERGTFNLARVARDAEGGTNRTRATFHRSRRVFFAPRVSHKIVARLYGGKRRCGKDERCDRLGGVF
mgnify:CR=1 FL=1